MKNVINKIMKLYLYKRNYLFMFILAIATLMYMLPYFILYDKAVFNIGDNLDSNVTWYMLLSRSEYYFSYEVGNYLEGFMDGAVPRNALSSPLKMTSLCFKFFKPIDAYILNKLLVHMMGVIGMFLFLLDFVFKRKSFIVPAILALSFGLLPNSVIFDGASFTIAPFVFYLYGRILSSHKNEPYLFYLLLFLTPFVASIVMTNLFIFMVLVVVSIFYIIQKRKIDKKIIYSLVVYLLGVVISDLGLFVLLFDEHFVSHRIDRSITIMSIKEGMVYILNVLLSNSYNHQKSLHLFILLALLPFSIYQIISRKRSIVYIYVFLILLYVAPVILRLDVLSPLTEIIPLINELDFSRFSSLYPFYWWVVWGCILSSILDITYSQYEKLIRLSVVVVSFLSLLWVVKNSWGYRENIKLALSSSKDRHSWDSNLQSFESFYSEDLFARVKQTLGAGDYLTISLGLHPGVMVYNQIPTVDGYAVLYSREHKIRFMKMIENELVLMPEQRAKFFHWGNRCYLFSHELLKIWNHKDFIFHKDKSSKFELSEFKVTSSDLSKMKVKYIISAIKIDQSQKLGYTLLEEFEDITSPYRVFLYKVN